MPSQQSLTVARCHKGGRTTEGHKEIEGSAFCYQLIGQLLHLTSYGAVKRLSDYTATVNQLPSEILFAQQDSVSVFCHERDLIAHRAPLLSPIAQSKHLWDRAAAKAKIVGAVISNAFGNKRLAAVAEAELQMGRGRLVYTKMKANRYRSCQCANPRSPW